MRYRSDLHRHIRLIAGKYYLFVVIDLTDIVSLSMLRKKYLIGENETASEYWAHSSRSLHRNMNDTPFYNIAFVNKVEKEHPGTKRIFKHPLWEILSTPEMSLDDVNKLYMELSADVQAKIIKTYRHTGKVEKVAFKTKGQISRISLISNLDALAALLLLMREFDITNRLDAYIQTKYSVNALIKRLTLYIPFLNVSQLIYHEIYRHFITRNNPIPERMLNGECIAYPHIYTSPLIYEDLYVIRDKYSTIIYYAQLYGLIKNSRKDKEKLLHIAQHFYASYQLCCRLSEVKHFEGEEKISSLPVLLEELSYYLSLPYKELISNDYLFERPADGDLSFWIKYAENNSNIRP